MRVICINAMPSERCTESLSYLLLLIKEGSVYEVEKFENDMLGGVYFLKGINTPYGFAVERFIPCSEQDEMELVLAENQTQHD